MWNAQITAQTQSHSNANGLIIQPETTCRNWKSVEPITTVGRSSFLNNNNNYYYYKEYF